MKRRLVKDNDLTDLEKQALNTIMELMDYINTHEFSKEAKDNFAEMMLSSTLGYEALLAMQKNQVLTTEEHEYLIGALTILVRSNTVA
jgi:hypothetical protein